MNRNTLALPIIYMILLEIASTVSLAALGMGVPVQTLHNPIVVQELVILLRDYTCI